MDDELQKRIHAAMSKIKEHKKITVVTIPITTPKEKVLECVSSDKILINAICEYRRYLEKNNVEVYSRSENILATEQGYMCAYYDEDLRNMEGGIDNPIPFKGKDGRMKVRIVAENGNVTNEDLADLVAMRYCPNPKEYKRTWFRDAQVENCDADNIFYISKLGYNTVKMLHKFGIKLKRPL